MPERWSKYIPEPTYSAEPFEPTDAIERVREAIARERAKPRDQQRPALLLRWRQELLRMGASVEH